MESAVPQELPNRDAAVVVARDAQGRVALLQAWFDDHDGEYLFLPGGRMEPGESILECAARELKEESGATAVELRPLGDFAITLGSTARVHLYEARGLTLGPQELTASETDFQLTWWTMADAVDAAVNGRFLLPAGPLALFMASRQESDAGWVPAPGH
ncbi:NUDIX hydrolase [Uniformispora flossi]|uniref:NUDIX hydrolase n=1 Tax=Uniformispora flossi TaxID=3390723 RepID=UPI003C309A54